MIRRINPIEGSGVVLVGRHPVSVFVSTSDHIDLLQRKSDGHYDRNDLMNLVKKGHATLYDETAVQAVLAATNDILFG